MGCKQGKSGSTIQIAAGLTQGTPSNSGKWDSLQTPKGAISDKSISVTSNNRKQASELTEKITSRKIRAQNQLNLPSDQNKFDHQRTNKSDLVQHGPATQSMTANYSINSLTQMILTQEFGLRMIQKHSNSETIDIEVARGGIKGIRDIRKSVDIKMSLNGVLNESISTSKSSLQKQVILKQKGMETNLNGDYRSSSIVNLKNINILPGMARISDKTSQHSGNSSSHKHSQSYIGSNAYQQMIQARQDPFLQFVNQKGFASGRENSALYNALQQIKQKKKPTGRKNRRWIEIQPEHTSAMFSIQTPSSSNYHSSNGKAKSSLSRYKDDSEDMENSDYDTTALDSQFDNIQVNYKSGGLGSRGSANLQIDKRSLYSESQQASSSSQGVSRPLGDISIEKLEQMVNEQFSPSTRSTMANIEVTSLSGGVSNKTPSTSTNQTENEFSQVRLSSGSQQQKDKLAVVVEEKSEEDQYSRKGSARGPPSDSPSSAGKKRASGSSFNKQATKKVKAQPHIYKKFAATGAQ